MFTLSANGYGIDLTTFITSYNFSVDPAFEYNELINGGLAKKYDLGNSSDKFYCDSTLTFDFKTTQNFLSFYELTKGSAISANTNTLDLFFPGVVTSSTCQIVEIRDGGYAGDDIMTYHKSFDVRFYLSGTPAYPVTTAVPSVFNRGIWQLEQTRTDTTKRAFYGTKSFFTDYDNDSLKWTVSFNYLTMNEAYQLLSWILTLRTDSATLTTNNYNSNLANKWKTGDPITTKTAPYKIRSFGFTKDGSGYSADLELVVSK